MTVPDILDLLNRPHLRGIALQDSRKAVHYRDLGESVRGLAGALVRQGVRSGDRVAVMLPNSEVCVELYLACALIGAIWVGINPSAPEAERERQCTLVSPTVLIGCDPGPAVTAWRFVEVADLDVEGAQFEESPPELNTPCAIAFSSGTTGTPKAVVHSRQAVSLTAAVLADAQLCADDRVGVILPMSIHNLIVVGALATLYAAATCVPIERMNAASVAAACRDRRLTKVNALVPATIYDLVHDDTIDPTSLSTLRVAGTGAAGLTEELRAAFEAKFGVRLSGSYGMTEAPGAVCVEGVGDPHAPGGSGRSLPHVLVESVDADDRPLGPNEEGDLVIRAADSGPWVGQFRPAIGTWTERGVQRRLVDDLILRTGDRGRVDADGIVYVAGRRDDVIIRGGVNVNAAEVESVLSDIPGVREAAVLGVSDPRLGQRIVAFVEPTSGAAVDSTSLHHYARRLLSHAKVPDDFVIRPLPRNAMGKVARGDLLNGIVDLSATAG
jgi:malonyl-CoA/methylmalonyl-CoA synthetase